MRMTKARAEATLGIYAEYGARELQACYLRAMRSCHPDLSCSDGANAAADQEIRNRMASDVNVAHDLLRPLVADGRRVRPEPRVAAPAAPAKPVPGDGGLGASVRPGVSGSSPTRDSGVGGRARIWSAEDEGGFCLNASNDRDARLAMAAMCEGQRVFRAHDRRYHRINLNYPVRDLHAAGELMDAWESSTLLRSQFAGYRDLYAAAYNELGTPDVPGWLRHMMIVQPKVDRVIRFFSS